MSKRKSVAMLDTSSDSDSDMSDSEFQKIAKKRKKSPNVEGSKSRSSSRSRSPSSSRSASRSRSRSSSSSGPDSDKDEDKAEAGLEKSSDVEDGEVSDSDSDVGEFDDGLDDKLMGDEEDRKRLEMMNEKEREEEIFKRAEKREMMKKRYEIEKKLKLQRKSTKEEMKTVNKALDTKERSRARKEAVENKKDKKSLALDVLKAKRKEKQEQQQKIEESNKKKEEDTDKKKWKTNDIYSSDSSDDEIERDRSRSPERKRSSSSSSSASSSSAESRSRSPSPVKRENIKSHEDLEKMRLTRTKLERWCHLPMFEDAVIGAFVRLSIGPNHEGVSVYRVAEIIGVVEGPKIYKLGKTRTNKYLKLRHGHQERLFRMEFVSQQMFSESEFLKWRMDTMTSGIMIPSMEEANHKKQQIEKFNNRRLNDKDIQHMIQEKQRFMDNPRNYAVFKSKLTKDRDAATAEGNFDEADRLSQRLAELEERAETLDKARSEKISTIALINDRNRKDNIAKAEENIKEEIERKRVEGETSDPFTRRKTKPMLATAVIAKKQNALAAGIELPKTQRAITKDTSIRPGRRKDDDGGKDDKKENQPQAKTKDLFSAHDFEIDINLDSFTPNSAIKLNLTPVINSTQDIGPKKSLNLSDYKKKRGLI